jgi:hypothetical protein
MRARMQVNRGVTAPPLTPLASDLWVATRPLPILVGDIGARMTVIRLRFGGLLLHSPVKLDSATRAALDELGSVRWIVGPSKVHHLFLPDYVRAYPEAVLCGAPGLPAKRADLRFTHVLDDTVRSQWRGEVEFLPFEGAPGLGEVVFFHPASRTLVLTDLAFNVRRGAPNRARTFHALVGAVGRFGPHRIVRLAIRDRQAARRSVDRLLAWDFDRVVVSHGEVLETGGKRAVETAFAFLP